MKFYWRFNGFFVVPSADTISNALYQSAYLQVMDGREYSSLYAIIDRHGKSRQPLPTTSSDTFFLLYPLNKFDIEQNQQPARKQLGKSIIQ
jgi:hypothetical protein